MQNINGKIAFRGIAIGKIKEISKETNVVRRVKINDVQAEIERFEAARDQAAQELKELYDKAVKEVGEANAAIFEVHQMMLEDEDYLDSIHNIIEVQAVNAEFPATTRCLISKSIWTASAALPLREDSGKPHLNQTIAERAFGKGPAPVLYIGGNE